MLITELSIVLILKVVTVKKLYRKQLLFILILCEYLSHYINYVIPDIKKITSF
jgi:hypothetical protein